MLLVLSSNTLFVVGLSSLTASSIYTLWSFLLTYYEEIDRVPLVISDFSSLTLSGTSF